TRPIQPRRCCAPPESRNSRHQNYALFQNRATRVTAHPESPAACYDRSPKGLWSVDGTPTACYAEFLGTARFSPAVLLMDIILHQLGELLLTALPTFFLVVFLTIYLRAMFFNPLDKVLKQRYEATEGARKLAEQSLERANAKTAEYE